MIFELMFDFALWIFEFIVECLPSLQPTLYSASSTLQDLLGVGVWFIGEDMWQFVLSSVSSWITLKITVGALLFAYRLIPGCG